MADDGQDLSVPDVEVQAAEHGVAVIREPQSSGGQDDITVAVALHVPAEVGHQAVVPHEGHDPLRRPISDHAPRFHEQDAAGVTKAPLQTVLHQDDADALLPVQLVKEIKVKAGRLIVQL